MLPTLTIFDDPVTIWSFLDKHTANDLLRHLAKQYLAVRGETDMAKGCAAPVVPLN